MNRTVKRMISGIAGLAAALSVVPILTAPAAYAAPSPQGVATLSPSSSTDSSAPFTVSLPPGAACAGDSANDNYRVGSYVVASSVDPATLRFDFTGPIPNQFGPPQATFSNPLYETGGSGYSTAQTANANPPPGPGSIINIPQFSFGVYTDVAAADGFNIPAGEYNVGIACYIVAPGSSPIEEYWNTTITVTDNPADPGPAKISWAVGATAAAPTLTAANADDTQCTAVFTAGGSNPPDTSYDATATPASGPPVTASGTGSPIVISGLANGTAYDVTVTADNGVGTSTTSNTLSCTPGVPPRPPVTGLSATPGSGQIDLSWNAPTGVAPASYQVDVTNPGSEPNGTTTVSGTTANVTGLTAGTLYTFTVTPIHGTPPNGLPASVAATPIGDLVIQQDISVVRPAGALILTQVCGTNGAIPSEPASTGFPVLPAVAADATGFAPTLTKGGSDPDPQFGNYPFPSPATYPTHCGLDLGTATLVTTGAAGGQFYRADGVLNQVTVVDTRDTTTAGWTISGTMTDFVANGGTDSFTGDQLGWTPIVTDDSDSYTLPGGATYDQVVTPGPAVLPGTLAGLGDGSTLASAAAGANQGIATLDARVRLLIPVSADAGTYEGTLSITGI